MKKLVKGDFVLIISGKYKNLKCKIIKVINDYVELSIFSIFNRKIFFKYFKKKKKIILNKRSKIHISNISLFNDNNYLSKCNFIHLFNNKKFKYLKKF